MDQIVGRAEGRMKTISVWTPWGMQTTPRRSRQGSAERQPGAKPLAFKTAVARLARRAGTRK